MAIEFLKWPRELKRGDAMKKSSCRDGFGAFLAECDCRSGTCLIYLWRVMDVLGIVEVANSQKRKE